MAAVVRAVPAAPVDGGERSRVERSKLRRELGRLDAVALLIAAMVVLDTVGTVARGGAQTVTWLAIVALLFFLPAGLAVAELGAAFPRQGGPYVWARLAFGRLVGSLVALAGPRRSRHGPGRRGHGDALWSVRRASRPTS